VRRIGVAEPMIILYRIGPDNSFQSGSRAVLGLGTPRAQCTEPTRDYAGRRGRSREAVNGGIWRGTDAWRWPRLCRWRRGARPRPANDCRRCCRAAERRCLPPPRLPVSWCLAAACVLADAAISPVNLADLPPRRALASDPTLAVAAAGAAKALVPTALSRRPHPRRRAGTPCSASAAMLAGAAPFRGAPAGLLSTRLSATPHSTETERTREGGRGGAPGREPVCRRRPPVRTARRPPRPWPLLNSPFATCLTCALVS